jgi:DNA-binding NtrC family response regulator
VPEVALLRSGTLTEVLPRCTPRFFMPTPADGSGPLIAVLNSSRDLVTLLQTALEQDGFRTISLVSTLTSGATGPLAFLQEHEPAAAVYSVSPPYQESWAILEEVRQRWQGGRFVITTTNAGALRAFVRTADAIELIGKPFDLDVITQALRRVLAAEPPTDDAAADDLCPAR